MRAFALPAVLAAAIVAGAASPMPLISYRAQYEVSMMPGGNARDLVGVRGLMVTEFRESCDGYIETQRFVADLTDADENTLRSDFTSKTWESRDGRAFNFTIGDMIVGKTSERYEGQAQSPPTGGGKATYTTPAGATVELPNGTLFPTEFSERLIAAARAGENSYTATVFHGDDLKELLVATVFIGREANGPDSELGGITAMNGVRSWPMVISYHKQGSDEATPAYEMSFRGYENGIATGMRMRYPTFALQSRLVKLEVLTPSCDRPRAPAN
jgi:EipB-like